MNSIARCCSHSWRGPKLARSFFPAATTGCHACPAPTASRQITNCSTALARTTKSPRSTSAQCRSWFETNVIHDVMPNDPGAGRRAYPGFLQHAGFVAMNPSRHFQSHWDFYQDLLRGDLDLSLIHI